ncbi:hypothetical protein DXG01_013459 [Tephrocybe rancida]|nr:hypothetical protein DXG01_013459 [Tephrocybe rancida]
MSSPFLFKPRALAKPKPKPNSTQHALPHASSSSIHTPPSTSTSITPMTKPKFSNEDYTNLFRLALSDYALWADSDLRRALDFSRESDEEGAGGFFPLTQLLKRSKVLAPLALENVQVQIVKALRAEGKVDVRLLVSEPSASTWGGQAYDRRDLGAYEIRRRETAGEVGGYSKLDWENRTIYVEGSKDREGSEATKFRFRVLSKSCWDQLKDEHVAYRARLVVKINAHQDVVEPLVPVPVSSPSFTSAPPPFIAEPRPEPEPEANPSLLAQNALYPSGVLVFVRNLHPETNKTTLRQSFARAVTDSAHDYIDFTKGMNFCHLGLTALTYAQALITHSTDRPMAQLWGLNDTGGDGGTPVRVELVEGTRERVGKRCSDDHCYPLVINVSFPAAVFHPPPTEPEDPAQPSPPPSRRNSVSTNDITANTSNDRYCESLIALPSPTGSSTPGSAEQSKHSSVPSAPSALSASGLITAIYCVLGTDDLRGTADGEQRQPRWPKGEGEDPSIRVGRSRGRGVAQEKGFDLDVCEKLTGVGSVISSIFIIIIYDSAAEPEFLLELDVNLQDRARNNGTRKMYAHRKCHHRPLQAPFVIYSDHLLPYAHIPRALPRALAPTVPSVLTSLVPWVVQWCSCTGTGTVPRRGTRRPQNKHMPRTMGSTMGMENYRRGLVSPPAMNGKGANGRPAHLMLSPSDGAPKESAMAVGVDNVPELEEDRGVASESEAVHSTRMRRRLFGRSYDSANSKLDSASRHSKKSSVSASASPVFAESKKDKNGDKDKGDKEKEKDRDSLGSLRPRSKKSTDSTGKGAGERLSIFGSTFSGTLGKRWKLPPRYPANTYREALALPRLTSNSCKASGHDRPPSTSTTGTATPKSTPKPTPKSAYKEAPVSSASSRGPALLRKRTSSAPAPPTDAKLLSPLKQGQSILEQIGDADFKGWMRKKGDREGNNADWVRIQETKIKGYMNIVGYKVTVDENVNPGRYGFRIEHDNDNTHYSSSDEKSAIRDWMKVIMKATIG